MVSTFQANIEIYSEKENLTRTYITFQLKKKKKIKKGLHTFS